LTLGKSTLAHVLLRIIDFDGGELLINDVPIQHYKPFELHSHISAVFQTFSKHNGTAKENIGVGHVEEMDSPPAIMKAAALAKATHIIESLPDGLDTKLDASGFYSSPCFTPGTFNSSTGEHPSYPYNGLSGGEVCKPLLY
jgi:ABC-type multidrug transport system fused ATPase/permease subunit